ncbi:translocation/assembly module TamB domain-containing protein [Actinomadura harenae]|uniref:Membrane-associated oxidoreductase n=1 Tax=Actinomadura harenae TaxID=2483351 RepID=A0A3M2M1V9_9ACTN|nr:hypothetical protein [Actinomadura harenae]RMI43050.1 hypothetical protein EBO15_17590 [Actinomadura harenae]
MPPDDLTDAEQLLWDAFPTGAWADLTTTPTTTIRAEVIRLLLLGGHDPEPGQLAAIRLRGATVTGRLDLMGASIDVALICEDCAFDAPLRLAEAVTRTVRLVGSRLHQLKAPRVRIEGLLDLRGTEIEHGIRIDQGEITGGLRLKGATIGRSESDVAIDGEGVSVRGDLACPDLVADGPVVLRGARITGQFDLAHARVVNPGAVALDIDNAGIGEGVDGCGMAAEGEIRMRSAEIGGPMLLSDARLSNPGGFALSAARAHVTGAFWCESGLTVEGEVRLVGVRFDGGVHLADAVLDGAGHVALNLDRASIGHLDAPRLTLRGGDIRLRGARVVGDFSLVEASLGPGRDGVCVDMENGEVGGTLRLGRLRADGEIRISNSRLDGSVLASRMRLSGAPTGASFRFTRNEVASGLRLLNVWADQEVRLVDSRFRLDVDLTGIELRIPGGTALDASGIQTTELVLLPGDAVEGRVVLDGARIGVLRDLPEKWPENLSMDGLVYETLQPALTARERLDWVERAPQDQRSQACDQLAQMYVHLGRQPQAQRILYERERGQRRFKPLIARAWSLVQDVTVGYGYRPWRAAAWVAFFLVIGTTVFSLDHPAPLKKDEAPHFNPFVYTLDLMLPLVTLGQKYAFNPKGAAQWFSYVLVAVGWILVSTVAAGVTRAVTRR